MLKKAEATANASVHILLGKLGYIHYYIAIADMEKAKKILQEVEKLIADDKLASSARTSDPRIFTESIVKNHHCGRYLFSCNSHTANHPERGNTA